ncbi:MAG: nucleotidyltransferase family protein [Candidatus Moraniibacteriota bacterium]
MTEQDILNLIKIDPWMMGVLHIAEKLNLPDWMIGAGFVRNKVWDHLHGYEKKPETADVDLIYFDPQGNDEKQDDALSKKLESETGIPWEIVNEFYAHVWNNIPPYTSSTDAISQWSETATSVGVRSRNSELELIAPHGIDDLVNLIVRPTPTFRSKLEKVKVRIEKKQWLEKWPKLRLAF